MNHDEIVLEFQEVGRLLWEGKVISSRGGNMSAHFADGRTLVTAHGSMLGHLAERDLLTVDAGGASDGEPSVDTALHLAIYKEQPEARAIVHAHPRHAIALSLVHPAIRPADLEGKHYFGTVVPIVEPNHLASTLKEHPVAVVKGHGSYAWGQDLRQALQWTTALEESAEVLWLLESLTGAGG